MWSGPAALAGPWQDPGKTLARPWAELCRALAHDPEIVLGGLVAVFHLDLVAAQRRLARKCHISLVIALRIGGSVGVRPALDRQLTVAVFGPTATAVARRARAVRPIVPVAHLVHENVIPIRVRAQRAKPMRVAHLHSPRPKPWRSRLQSRL